MNNARKNFDCPALMADGRFATDYRPSCVQLMELAKKTNTYSSNAQRAYLQHNGSKVTKQHRAAFTKQASCGSCKTKLVDPNWNDRYHKAHKSFLGRLSGKLY